MRRNYVTKVACKTLALTAGMIGTPTLAQITSDVAAPTRGAKASSEGIEDIIVTARRQSETLLNVPVQVTVRSGEDLGRVNANDLPKIAETIPFVTISRQQSGNGGGFVIRGKQPAV